MFVRNYSQTSELPRLSSVDDDYDGDDIDDEDDGDDDDKGLLVNLHKKWEIPGDNLATNSNRLVPE